jgi:hypothetical protein
MDTDAKMAAIHAVAAIGAAYASFTTSNGSIAALGQNQALGTLVGVVILIIVGNLAERFLGKEEVGGFKGWLWSGIIPFVFVWFMVWAMLINVHL